ncbi:MAG: L-threonylcarbamoyladenylate synthase [Thermodesulfobacteriota bacterium]
MFKRGGIIAYPTETFYALGVDPFNPAAIEALFHLKGRSFSNPVALIIAGEDMLRAVAGDTPPAAKKLMESFWPGPLTIVMKARASVPPVLIGSTGKVGVRMPGHPAARALSATLRSPITATSANPTGARPPVTAGEVLGYFDGSIDMLIDAGTLAGRLGSTIVDVTGTEPRIIREGEIPSSEVFEALQRP